MAGNSGIDTLDSTSHGSLGARPGVNAPASEPERFSDGPIRNIHPKIYLKKLLPKGRMVFSRLNSMV